MTTELQQNFNAIAFRMKQKYAEKAYLFHYPPCIVPAWEEIIDSIISTVEDWNATNEKEQSVGIFQMKEKFGQLTVYLEPTDASGVVNTPEEVRIKVRSLAKEAQKICRACGKQKVETVHESRIQYRCLDHYNSERWRIRE